MKILIAEDSPLAKAMLTDALNALGHEVIACADGEEAWQRFQNESVRLVITDWMMPVMDGLTLCRRIRERDASPYTYLLLLTSREGREDRLEGLAAGADDFLVKPLDPSELAARVKVGERVLAMQETLLGHTRQIEAQIARIDAYSHELEAQKGELESANAKLEALAVTDGLTGLKNHRAFQEHWEQEFALAVRHDLPLSLALLDVDHFKKFNDTYGHPAGDEVLRTIARIVQESARETDIVARYGGEEFALILRHTEQAGALTFIERVRARIAAAPSSYGPLTASFGVSTRSSETRDRKQMIAEADSALYVSKRNGRNRVAHFTQQESAPSPDTPPLASRQDAPVLAPEGDDVAREAIGPGEQGRSDSGGAAARYRAVAWGARNVSAAAHVFGNPGSRARFLRSA